MRRTLLLVPALVVLAGCGSAPSAPAPSAPGPAPSATAPRTSPARATPTRRATPAISLSRSSRPVLFTTSDGDVGCDVEAAYARCDTRRHTWPLPPRPSDCQSGWGHGIELQLLSRASFFCGSDSVLGGKHVVVTGHGVAVGDVECDVVAASTVQCRTDVGAHGFRVSRTAYTLS